ncbi:uncharacterized 47.3 kDa protein in thcA 5'region [Arthrobacter sp. Hiyo8]|nr:uncharacterized 47.3 kDa protein in thcA 5'region [Arthrobacter sp. Hiyo8]
MKNPIHPAASVNDAAELLQRHARAGHEHLESWRYGLPDATELPGLRSLIKESWQRSAQLKANPDQPEAPLVIDLDELEEYRRQHPLATIMPVIQKLLIQPSYESGLLVAVGDELGRLLWVDGNPAMRRRAEGMMFVAGADWSEAAVGTSAPGTALALGRGIQISGAEHYKRSVHPWSCTAVPFHDPDSGALLGVVDITGTEAAVAPHTLSLVEATVAAAQAQLRVERLQLAATKHSAPARRRNSPSAVGSRQGTGLYRNSLQLLGRDQALLSIGGRSIPLSARHSEILALLGTRPEGSVPRSSPWPSIRGWLERDVAGRNGAPAQGAPRARPAAVPESRPYRLPIDLGQDAAQVLSCLQRAPTASRWRSTKAPSFRIRKRPASWSSARRFRRSCARRS